MILSCALGIELYNAHNYGADPNKVLLGLKGADRSEQLTLSELRELTEISDSFNKATLIPKNVRNVEIEFILGKYFVPLGQFSKMCKAHFTMDIVEEFCSERIDHMPAILGRIYAPVIKQVFDLTDPVEKIAADTADAILEQVPFEDVYSVFDFFVLWKEYLTKVPNLSSRQALNSYRLRRSLLKSKRLLLSRSLTSSKPPPATSSIQQLIFILRMSIAIPSGWFWLLISSIRDWWLKRPVW